MPFTPAHVAAILPLRRVRGSGLPLAALAAGSMSPDLPYYLPFGSYLNRWTHTPLGVITIDVLLGLVMWAVWRSINPAVHHLSPAPIRERWTPATWGSSTWKLVVLAVLIGAITHVVWDEFTHAGRWGATHLAVLAATYPSPIGPLAGFKYAQYASGGFGLAILAWFCWRCPRTRDQVIQPRLARLPPWALLAAFAVGAAIRVALSARPGAPWDAYVFSALTGGIGAAVAAGLLACWGQQWADRRTSAPQPVE